ncbi:MAG: aldo/keto reductase family protein [Candidatus Eremiobacteraeota bacterium]|nr:aldo/keto reductase family protein [Candidatus Eremiobacteraeota bacterium]
MQYRSLGHSGLKLSVVGLGSWLTYGKSVEKDMARKCVLRAYESGVNFIDTANIYAQGVAEEVLGPIIKQLHRDAIVLASKVYFPMGMSPNERGLSRKHIHDQIHRSLHRLQVDYIDLYQCHRYDLETPVEETAQMMNDLVRAGKILYWGTSEWNADQIVSIVNLCRARGWAVPVSNQPQYSALWRRVEERVLPACEQYGIGNVVWSPLAMGILAGKYTDTKHPPQGTRAAGESKEMMEEYFTQPVLDAVQKLGPLAKRANASMAQLALAWCLRQRAVTSVIVGATKVEQVDDNVAAADLNIDPAIFDEMDKILKPVAPYEPYGS